MEVVASVCLAIGRKGRLAFSSDSMVKMIPWCKLSFFGVIIIFIPGEEGEVEEEKDEETPLPGQVDQAVEGKVEVEGEADDAGGAEDEQAPDADDLDM